MAKNSGNNSAAGKLDALEVAIQHLEKRFGKGVVMRLGEGGNRGPVKVIPTGSLSLDLALGVGGIPRGRVTELFGPESSGKSTLAQHIVTEAQKAGGTAVYIDVEHALDAEYAARCGVKIEDLLISQPGCGEEALEIADAVVRSGAIDVVVIDSVAALVPRAEIEGEMGDAHVGLQARLMSQALRKLCAATSRSHTAVIFINQLRQMIGKVYGNPEVTPGGRALKFYASVRIDLRLGDQIKEGEMVLGRTVRARVVKNKVAPPFRGATFDIMFGDGISREGEVIDLGADLGIVEKKGSWYQWNGNMLGNGREAAKKFLKENQGMAQEIETLIRSKAMANAHVVEAVSSIPGARVPVGDDAGDGHHDWGEEAVEPVQDETWVEDS
jgi:recombination protein RecA